MDMSFLNDGTSYHKDDWSYGYKTEEPENWILGPEFSSLDVPSADISYYNSSEHDFDDQETFSFKGEFPIAKDFPSPHFEIASSIYGGENYYNVLPESSKGTVERDSKFPIYDETFRDTLPSVYPSPGRSDTTLSPREHPLYRKAMPGPDGLYHCPWAPECNHKPDKLKCNYE